MVSGVAAAPVGSVIVLKVVRPVFAVAGPVGIVPAGLVIVPKVVRPLVIGAIVSVGSAVGAIVPFGTAVAAGLVIVDTLVVRPRVIVELVIVDNLVVRPCVLRVLMYQPAPSLFTLVAVIPAAIATDDDPVICSSDAQFELDKGSYLSVIRSHSLVRPRMARDPSLLQRET